MDPSYAEKLLALNKHTSDPDTYSNPFATAEEMQLRPKRQRRLTFRQASQATLAHSGQMTAKLMAVLDPAKMSEDRARIAVMNHDTVSAGLWALSGFDPALVHLAELRERFAHLAEDDPIRITLDRLTSVYVEGQCRELLHAAGITTLIDTQVGGLVNIQLGGLSVDATLQQILACTSDPLAVEIYSYAQHLGVLTAHGTAPWKRFAAVMADCHSHLVA